MPIKVKVQFPDGEVRDIEPVGWEVLSENDALSGGRHFAPGQPKPIFDLPGYDVHAAMGDRWFAIRTVDGN
jgi:hypothetical protein